MSNWSSREDAFIRFGSVWLRRGAVDTVTDLGEGESNVHLQSGRTVTVNRSADEVVQILCEEG